MSDQVTEFKASELLAQTVNQHYEDFCKAVDDALLGRIAQHMRDNGWTVEPPEEGGRGVSVRLGIQGLVEGFHRAFGHPVASKPGLISDERADLRFALIREEVQELHEAMVHDDLVEIADALADILYVTYGAAAEYGIDLDAVVRNEVHQSNMSKLDDDGKPVPHPTVPGKIGKSANFREPNIARELNRQLGL